MLASAAKGCHGCDLFRYATQTVFGAGPRTSRIMMIGEEPGDEEDKQGKPFVGPAGRVLDRALAEAGIDRSEIYVTNAVKHFKFEERGKRRIHKKPTNAEVRACRPWLEAEVGAIHPRVIVCLGATAALSVFGNKFRLMEERGKARQHEWAPFAMATIHPSAILRMPEPEQRHEELRRLTADLVAARKLLEGASKERT